MEVVLQSIGNFFLLFYFSSLVVTLPILLITAWILSRGFNLYWIFLMVCLFCVFISPFVVAFGYVNIGFSLLFYPLIFIVAWFLAVILGIFCWIIFIIVVEIPLSIIRTIIPGFKFSFGKQIYKLYAKVID